MPRLAEQIIPRRKLLLMASECVIVAGILFFGTSLPPLASQSVDLTTVTPKLLRSMLTCFTIAVICQASLSYNDLYDWRISQNRAELPNRLIHSGGYALVMLAVLVLLLPSLFVFPGLKNVSTETGKLILLLGIAFLAIYGWRAGFHWFFYKWRFGEQVLVLGAGGSAQELARMIADNPMAGFELVGLVAEPEAKPALANDLSLQPWQRVIGTVDQLAELALRHSVARVVVSLHERRGQLPVEQLLQCRMDGVLVEEREVMYERLTGKIAVESMRPSYLIFGRGFTKEPLTVVTKRLIDIVASLVGLVVSAPICLLAAGIIKLSSRGPVLFRQERVGQEGQIFNVLKFRTMQVDAEKESGPVWATANDHRVTWVGRILRVTRIDEIPQFINVLAGRMSFVGPRPERPHFVEQLSQEIPFYPLRHTVKPGLTGWAQVRYPYGASVEDAMEKLRYDLYYIKNMSPLFDVNIILRTTGVILLGKGAR